MRHVGPSVFTIIFLSIALAGCATAQSADLSTRPCRDSAEAGCHDPQPRHRVL